MEYDYPFINQSIRIRTRVSTKVKEIYPNEGNSVQHCIKLIVENLIESGEVAYSKSDSFYTKEHTKHYTKTNMLRAVELLVNDGYIKLSKSGSKNINYKQGISSRIKRTAKLQVNFPKMKAVRVNLSRFPLLRVNDKPIYTALDAQEMEDRLNAIGSNNTSPSNSTAIDKADITSMPSNNILITHIPIRRFWNVSFCLNHDYFHKMKLDFGALNLNKSYLRQVGLTRVFTDNQFCGRWYQLHGKSYQQLSKAERVKILLDGQEVSELDYSAMHPHILCAWENQPAPKDFYESVVNILVGTYPLITRDVVKKVVLMSVNAKDKTQLNRAIAHDSHEERQANKTRLNEGRDTKPIMSDEISKSGVSIEVIVKTFQQTHPLLSKYVYSQSAGKLMFSESEIMTSVLEALKKQNIPAVPIHDSLLFPKQYTPQVKQVMLDCYKKQTGFDIEVK